jgi:hypothetical protein
VAPELGHIRVVPDGRPCACGKNGCWERYCSGTALATTAVELLARDHLHSPVLGRLAAVDPGQVTGQRVAAAAREGDPVACAAMADLACWLGEGLALVADVFDPELMVIGGGVSESAPLFLDEAREHYAARLTGRGNRPLARVRVAQLGEAAAVVGAASWPASTRSPVSGAQSCAPSSSSSRSSGGAGHSRSTEPAQSGRQREQAQRQPVDVRDADRVRRDDEDEPEDEQRDPDGGRRADARQRRRLRRDEVLEAVRLGLVRPVRPAREGREARRTAGCGWFGRRPLVAGPGGHGALAAPPGDDRLELVSGGIRPVGLVGFAVHPASHATRPARHVILTRRRPPRGDAGVCRCVQRSGGRQRRSGVPVVTAGTTSLGWSPST